MCRGSPQGWLLLLDETSRRVNKTYIDQQKCNLFKVHTYLHYIMSLETHTKRQILWLSDQCLVENLLYHMSKWEVMEFIGESWSCSAVRCGRNDHECRSWQSNAQFNYVIYRNKEYNSDRMTIIRFLNLMKKKYCIL